MLLFTASDLASITSHIHNWVLFLLWLLPFILSGVIFPLSSSSILGTYWPGEFLFQYPIILPFRAVHGVLKARILKWFAIPFSSGPHSVRPLHHDLPVLGCPAGMAWFHWVRQGCGPSVIGAPYATGDQWRNNSRKNEGMEPKQKQYPVVDVTGDRSKIHAVKSNIAYEPGMSGPWIKASWKWSNKWWQGWTSTF